MVACRGGLAIAVVPPFAKYIFFITVGHMGARGFFRHGGTYGRQAVFFFAVGHTGDKRPSTHPTSRPF